MNNKIKHLYEFADFRIDLAQKCLWQNKEVISLTPKQFETLVVLVEKKGQIVDKETLLDRVWADTFVEEATLTQNISTLRKTLAGFGNGKQFIETIPRRGYRFVEEVREVFDDEEIYLVETLTRTHISAQQTIEEKSSNQTLRKKRVILGVGVFVFVCIIIGSFFVLKYSNFGKNSFAEKFEKIQIQKLASSGNIHRATISPDGKYLALIEKKDDSSRILLQQTNNSNQVEIVSPTNNNFIGAAFSPDSQSLLYSIYESLENDPKTRIGVLYKIPILGGTKTEILRDIDSPPAISSDGNRYAFIRQSPKNKQSSLIIYDTANKEKPENTIVSRSLKETFSTDGLSFSPDGKYIAVASFNSQKPENPYELTAVNLANGEQTPISSSHWFWIGKTVWLKNGDGIIFTAYNKNSPNYTDEIWFASYPKGDLKKITNGINGISGISITDDSKSIIATVSNRVSSLAASYANNPESVVTINKQVGDNSLIKLTMDWTPDGKIVYSSSQGGNSDIWSVNEDGSNLAQLTNELTAEYNPVVSNDGKYIVFLSNRSGTPGLLRMNADGTNVKKLAEFSEISSPSISPDGQTVYFSARQTNSFAVLWKVSIEGGEPIQITEGRTLFPQVSPDGKYIVCRFPKIDNDGKSQRLIPTILTMPDGKIYKQFEDLEIAPETPFQWNADGSAISFSTYKAGVSNIWLLPIQENQPKKMLTFISDEIFRFRWSKDGKKIAFEKGQKSDEVIKITE